MITRLYIDNFRAFVNFEFMAQSRQLLLGANGTGKSSLLEAVMLLRSIVVAGDKVDESVRLQRCRFLSTNLQTFEADARIGPSNFRYRIQIGGQGNPERPYIASERLDMDGEVLVELKNELATFAIGNGKSVQLAMNGERSVVATIAAPANPQVKKFLSWFASILVFRINPFDMLPFSEQESNFSRVDLTNLASWYRAMTQSMPIESTLLGESLKTALPGFSHFTMPPGANLSRALFAHFEYGELRPAFLLTELSEGQRCLIGLYAILEFAIKQGSTVLLDEPDNFVGLQELQPWLTAVDDAVAEHSAQVLIISHNPEYIDRWAADFGVHFFREGNGPVRIKPFQKDPSDPLRLSELLARGYAGD